MEQEPQDPLQEQEDPEIQEIFLQQGGEILHMEEAPWEEPQNPLQEQVPEIQHQFQMEGEIQQMGEAPQQEPRDPSGGSLENEVSLETPRQFEELVRQTSEPVYSGPLQLRPQNLQLVSEISQIDHQDPQTSTHVYNPVMLETLETAIQDQPLGRERSQMEQDTRDTDLERPVPQMGRQALAMGHRGAQSRRQSWRTNRQAHSLDNGEQSSEYEAPELEPRHSSLPTSPHVFSHIDPPPHSYDTPPIICPIPFRNPNMQPFGNGQNGLEGIGQHIMQHQNRDHELNTAEEEVPQLDGQDLSSIDTEQSLSMIDTEQSLSMSTPTDMELQSPAPEQNSPLPDEEVQQLGDLAPEQNIPLPDEEVPQLGDLDRSPNQDLSPS